MVAQSFETVQPWGQTSPATASTPDDHLPMDLVTRNRGQSDLQLVSDYIKKFTGPDFPQEIVEFETLSDIVNQNEELIELETVTPQDISISEQLSKDDVLKLKQDVHKSQHLGFHDDGKSLQLVKKQMAGKQQDKMQFQFVVQNDIKSADIQGHDEGSLNDFPGEMKNKSRSSSVEGDQQAPSSSETNTWSCENSQSILPIRMKQHLLSRWNSNGDIETTMRTNQMQDYQRVNLVNKNAHQKDKIMIQEHETSSLNEISKKKRNNIPCQVQESRNCASLPNQETPELKVEDADKQGTTTSIESAHQNIREDQEQASATAIASLLLLSDEKWTNPSQDSSQVDPKIQMLGTQNQTLLKVRTFQWNGLSLENMDKNLPGQELQAEKKTLSGSETDNHLRQTSVNQNYLSGYVEDDKDENLVIVDGDYQIVSSETEEQDIAPSDAKAQYDEAEMHKPIDEENQTLDKEELNKQGAVPKSKNRLESQKKMEDGKNWLVNNLMMLSGTLTVIKLSDIEESYLKYCHENNKDPLATPVLARLIHNIFPSANKCRLGARGNQRIHYRNLSFKSELDGQETSELHEEEQKKEIKVQITEEIQVPTQHKELLTKSSYQAHESCDQQISNGPQANLYEEMQMNSTTTANVDPLKIELQQAGLHGKNIFNFTSQDDEESCKAAAKKFSEVLKWITSRGEGHKRALLRDFAHSASCQKPTCEPVCLMFRRVRRHVVAAQHSCSVLRLYSMLLRHHVSSCTQMKCGLPACPALRKTQSQKRPTEQLHHPSKRVAVAPGSGLIYPSNFVLSSRSPGGSLPGSPVNSPPQSPSSSFGSVINIPSGQQMKVVMVPVMMSVVENPAA